MESLKGSTILIGKEPGQGRLLVVVGDKAAAIGTPGSVPNSVSRCKTAEGVAHAKITVDQNGQITITNLKPQNTTYVDGAEIVSKRILPSSTVTLGKDRYAVNLPLIIETAKRLVQSTPHSNTHAQRPNPTKPYHISHLERVWNEYHDELRRIRDRQRKQQLSARLPFFFTTGGSAISFALSFIFGEQFKTEIQVISGVLLFVGVGLLIRSFLISRNDTSVEDQERALEKIQDEYVCPNPDCGKFYGNNSYKLIRKQFKNPKDQKLYCPHCGAQLS